MFTLARVLALQGPLSAGAMVTSVIGCWSSQVWSYYTLTDQAPFPVVKPGESISTPNSTTQFIEKRDYNRIMCVTLLDCQANHMASHVLQYEY